MMDDRRSTWDFSLLVITVALLGGLGVQSLVGTIYSWWATRTISGWATSPAFASYIEAMNLIAVPMIVGLAVVMGLCVPKRLFSRPALIVVSVLMVVAGTLAWAVTGSASNGLAVYLLGAGGVQLAVVIMTLTGSASLSYLTEGRLTKVGSGLLHLGFIIFGYVVVALQDSPVMLLAFAVAFVLAIGGTSLSFYAGDIARRKGTPTIP
jgi:hypothetical protein